MTFDKIFLLIRMVAPVATALDRYVAPLADLFMRIILFRVFFYSGLVKLDNWSGTLELFEYEYIIPFTPPVLAAYGGTAAELICPVLLLAGLGARLAALPLLAMTLVIQFVLGASNPAYDQLDHFLWMALLLSIITRGAGTLSIDYWLVRHSLK